MRAGREEGKEEKGRERKRREAARQTAAATRRGEREIAAIRRPCSDLMSERRRVRERDRRRFHATLSESTYTRPTRSHRAERRKRDQLRNKGQASIQWGRYAHPAQAKYLTTAAQLTGSRAVSSREPGARSVHVRLQPPPQRWWVIHQNHRGSRASEIWTGRAARAQGTTAGWAIGRRYRHDWSISPLEGGEISPAPFGM